MTIGPYARPDTLGIGVVLLATLSVVLAVLTAVRWNRSERPARGPDSRHGTLRGNLILFAVSGAFVGAVWILAGPLGWKLDRALWLGFGGVLAVMTLARPWWFWDNYRARWLRGAIGDEATAAVYLVLAGVMVWVGLFTDWTFGRR